MNKKPNLKDALANASGGAAPQIKERPFESTPSVERSRVENAASPSRRGKKAVTGYFDPAVSHQLKQIALDKDTTLQDLLSEAINDLFQKNGKPTLA